VALGCSILVSGIGSDANKISINISSELLILMVFFVYAQFVAQSFLRQNLSWRMWQREVM